MIFGLQCANLMVQTVLHDFMTPFNMVQYPDMCALLSIVCDVSCVLSLTAEGDDPENL